MDFNKMAPDRVKADPFAEVPTSEKFKTLMNEIWNNRLEVAEFN
jgi:Txe/YoeB family toxin of Txe-Axe toxin-antitoxin module